MERILKLVRQSGLTFTFVDANDESDSSIAVSAKFKVENDDAATAGYSSNYWMMSKQDVEEILQYATLTYDNSRSLVECTIGSKVLRFPIGTYWTSTRDSEDQSKAWCLIASNTAPLLTLTTDDRYKGHFIRAVLDRDDVEGSYYGEDITHKWYTLNLGSSAMNGSGSLLYAWGETESKDSFTIDNYKFGSSYNKYNNSDGLLELSHHSGYADCKTIIANDDSITFIGDDSALCINMTSNGSFDIGDLITDETGQNIRDALLELRTDMETIKNKIGPNSGNNDGGVCDTGKRVVLKTADEFESLIANTVYEINKDFVLTGTYDIPECVTFLFAGGSITGGSFSCLDSSSDSYYKDKTKRPLLVGDVKFNVSNYDMIWNGGFANDEIDYEWFNPSISVTSNNNAELVESIVSQLHDQVLNIGNMYPLLKSITISSGSATLNSKNQFQGGYGPWIGSCNAGFYIVGKLFSAIIQTGGRLNLKGLSFIGGTGYTNAARTSLYCMFGSRNAWNSGTFNQTFYDKYGQSYSLNSSASGSEAPNSRNFCGFDLRQGSVELIEDCCFNGFCRGISFDGSKTWATCTPGFINRCFISSCKWGMYALFVSDFFCTNCKFNSCNSDCTDGISNATGRTLKNQGWVNSDTKRHVDYGGGVFIGSSAMIQFDACRWEFNYLGIYIDNASYNINITGCIFDRHTHSILTIYNSPDHYSSGSDVFPDRRNPAFCGINFTGNNILRGLGSRENWSSSTPSLTPGVAYFCVYSRPDSSTDAWVTQSDNLRKVDLTIVGNTFEDNQEMRFDGVSSGGSFNPQNLTYEKSLFMFDVTDNEGVTINLTGNDFKYSKASYFVESYNSSSTSNKGCVRIDGSGNTYPTNMVFGTPFFHTSDARKNATIVHLNEMFVDDGEFFYYDTQNGGGILPKNWYGTQEEYNALTTTYPKTIYNIY